MPPGLNSRFGINGAGDVIMWGNRASMHRGRPWVHDQARSMVRTTLSAADVDGLTDLRPGEIQYATDGSQAPSGWL
jgi:hypothetical protein